MLIFMSTLINLTMLTQHFRKFFLNFLKLLTRPVTMSKTPPSVLCWIVPSLVSRSDFAI